MGALDCAGIGDVPGHDEEGVGREASDAAREADGDRDILNARLA